jgi:catechol 2,3-dioxygenase-like lactoylglutathione lyase family enzyme
MYDHVGLKVRDLNASVRFYEAALAPLGHTLGPHDDESAAIGPPGEAALWLYSAKGVASSATHIAFRAATRSAVARFHAAGLKAGGRDNGAAGLRTEYDANYYAAFLFDPDGNNIEAVCLAETR